MILAVGRRHVGLSDRRGFATVEFALIASLMMTIMFATIEFSNMFRVSAKLNTATGVLASIIAANSSVTAKSGTLADLCSGAILNLGPFPRGTMSADIVSLTNDHPSNRILGSTDSSTVQTYLDWENVSSCPTRSASTMGLPGAYNLANSPQSVLTRSGSPASGPSDLAYSYSAVVVSTSYTYQNILTLFLGQSITLSGVAVVRPRSNTTISCTNVAGSAPCPFLQ